MSDILQSLAIPPADPAVIGEIVKGVGYGLSLFFTFLWSEVRRTRTTKQQTARDRAEAAAKERQDQERRERERRLDQQALDYRFNEVHKQLESDREATQGTLQDLSRAVDRLSGLVGDTGDDGMRGQLTDSGGDIRSLAKQMTDHALDDEKRFGSIELGIAEIKASRTAERENRK